VKGFSLFVVCNFGERLVKLKKDIGLGTGSIVDQLKQPDRKGSKERNKRRKIMGMDLT